MTPEEAFHKAFRTYLDTHGDKKEAVAIIQQAKSEWCKEQRENCFKRLIHIDFTKDFMEHIKTAILQAPEPK
jgi:hypothetical protein